MNSKLSLVLLSALPCLYAYKIDASCSGNDASLMKDAAEQAFDMASQAYDALTVTGMRDSNVDRLVELLFCREGQAAADLDTSALINSYLGIRQMRNENPDVGNNPDEVVIYCNMDRLEKRADGWYDTGMSFMCYRTKCSTLTADSQRHCPGRSPKPRAAGVHRQEGQDACIHLDSRGWRR